MPENTQHQSKIGSEFSIEERRAALEQCFPEWPRHTVAEHFSEMCRQYANRPFIYIEDDTVTYGKVWTEALRYAKSFLKLGVKRREHIAVLMENDKVYPSLMIAASIVGAVFIPINTMLSRDELGYILQQSDSSYLLLHDRIKGNDTAGFVKDLLDDPAFQEASVLEHVVCMSTGDSADQFFIDWDDFYAGGEAASEAELDARYNASLYPDEVAQIMYTSGSTGKPKGVMLTHDHLLRCSYSTCLSRAIEDGRVTFAPLPFYHCFAIVEGILGMSFVGGSLISASRFSPLSALEKMEAYKANDFLCVPSMLVPLLNEPERVSEFDLSHLFAIWCGAAPAPVHVWENAVKTLGLTEILTGYGQTEVTSSGVTTELDDPIERIATRVGRPKLGGAAGLPEFNGSTVQYKTSDPETGEDLEPGSVGALVIRGCTVTNGYYNKPDETAKAIDKDGWLHTGDVGRIDENGYIELLGRTSDLYKVSGELVAPREVEEVIAEHPAVNQVFIVGVPDKVTTEAGAAFVELKPGESCVRRDIIDWCSSRVARFKIPRHVWFIEASDWPLTSTSKVQKFRLKEMAEERIERKR
ncbi:class I adenylate-forming enzyme family protein [Virgibacillus ihumii]|uniref:class I adenylate-forming enzyme family protein n=1 Tax=Virgibacillus ihumii TaxID=2686091 RepID=UPI00157D10EC|nr:class I adenylate-forming enzyme family protein [Virgibacillus ihumii]